MKKIISKVFRFHKPLFKVLLSANLLLIATGSADLELATPSASPDSSPTAEVSSSPSPSPLPSPSSVLDVLSPRKIDPTGRFVENEVVVKFKDGTSEENKGSSFSGETISLKRDNTILGSRTYRVPSERREAILEKLSKNPNVEFAEKNFVATTGVWGGGGGGGGSGLPYLNDPYYLSQWNLTRIQVAWVWNYYKGTAGAKVAMIDTGVNYNLDEFGQYKYGGRIINEYDFVNDDWDSMDDNWHGTAVASIMAAKTNNGIGIAGIDWYGAVVSFKVFGANNGGTYDDMAGAISTAANSYPTIGAINVSGYGPDYSQNLANAVSYAQSKNILIVASTINNTQTTNCFMGFPAAFSGVIAVVATNTNDVWATGCTRSYYYDANGNLNSFSGQYLMAAPGWNVWGLNLNGSVNNVLTGTSFAAPHISGTAGLLHSCSGYPKGAELRNALIWGATDLGQAGWDSTYGFGRLNSYSSMGYLDGC